MSGPSITGTARSTLRDRSMEGHTRCVRMLPVRFWSGQTRGLLTVLARKQ